MQPEEFERVLGTCGSPNDKERNEAEKVVTQMMKKKEIVPLLVMQVSQSQHVGVRQLASILLRKKVLGFWRKLEVSARTGMKEALLASAVKEPVRVVRLGITHCIAMLAKAELPSGTWPELFGFLQENSKAAEPQRRELVILLILACSSTMTSQLSSQSHVLSQFLLQGLSDSEGSIRLLTLRAASALLSEIDLDVSVITQLLPAMFEVMKASVNTEDEDLFTTAFELLDELLDVPTFKGKNETLLQVAQFCLQIAGGTGGHGKHREKACDILGKICHNKPKFTVSKGLVQPILELAMKLLADPSCTGSMLEADEDTQTMSPVAIGSSLLDTVSDSLPSKAVGTPMLGWIKSEFVDKKTTDPFTKKASILALAAMSVGCRDLLRENIEFVVEVAKQCVSDPSPVVREAALVASSQFTDYLQPEILEHHSVLLPLGMELLSDQNAYVREKAAYMVDTFAENLGKDAMPYASTLLHKLATIVATDAGPEGMKSRCVAVSAISSVAEAIRDEFKQFGDDAFKLLLPLLRHNEDEFLTLRARSTDAIGICANAVGAATFLPYFEQTMQLVGQGLTLEAPEVNEYSYGFWSNMAEIYPNEMASLLEQTVPALLKEIDQEEGEYTSNNPFADLPNAQLADEESDSESDDDLENDSIYDGRLRVDNKIVLARASALHCLGIFAKTSGAPFSKFCAEAALRASQNVNHYDTTVRKNALELLVHVTSWVHGQHYVERVVGFPTSDTLAMETREAITSTLMTILQVMRTDDDKEVVAVACDGLGELQDKIGSVAVHNHIDAILGEVKKLLANQAPCQVVEQEDDDDDLPEDHDQRLIDGVFELIDKTAKAYGPGFRPMFDELLPGILRYLEPKRPESDHVMVIATLGEVAVALGDRIAGHTDSFIDICLHGLKSKEAGVRNNSCFTIGAVCQSSGAQSTQPKFPAILTALGEVINKKKERGDVIDNAVSAVCRLIKLDPAACHLPQILPVLLQHIPLKVDYSENENVYSTLKFLLECSADTVKPHLQEFISVLTRGMGHASTSPGAKMELANMLQGLAATPEGKAVMPALPDDLQQILRTQVFF